MEGANASTQTSQTPQAQPVGSTASERRGNSKVIAVILGILAIGIIAAIIILAVVVPNSSNSESSTASNGTASSGAEDEDITELQSEYWRLTGEVQALANEKSPNPDLETAINVFIQNVTDEYGVNTTQWSNAKVLLFDYYLAAGLDDYAVSYMNNQISATDDATSQVYYYLALYDYYKQDDEMDIQIDTLEKLLQIPTEAVDLYGEDWSALRDDYVNILNTLYRRNEE